MRYLPFLLGVFIFSQLSHSQIYEIGIFAGGSNVIGDVGPTNYIRPNTFAVGGIAKWNRSPRHSFRASAIYSRLNGADIDSDDPRRIQRGYEFAMNTIEFSAGLEFTFLEFDLHKQGLQVAPYLYSGISTLYHNNYYYNATGAFTFENTASWAWGIPMVIGVKSNVTPHLVLALELGLRYTFSDEIDASVPDSPQREQFSIGNINSNDWYNFTGLTLTYTFGRRPCYCNF
jgi:hypothetical protein